MKKAIIYLIACIGLCSLIMVPERVTFAFFVDYIIRMAILGWAGNKLVEMDKKKA